MRTFIAVNIDQTTRTALSDLQQRLKDSVDIQKGDVKWVNPEAVHLTLKFLGEVRDKKIVDICNIVKEIAARHESFELDIESVGHFGSQNARVLWVGLGEGKEPLFRLQQELEEKFDSAGWPKEKREFTGHLTLCRIRNSKAGYKLAQAGKQYEDFKLGTMSVDSVSVYESQLRPEGPIYTALCNHKLGI